ncbi:MAG: 5-amino-6-(D-ribitylamino)uracil--L-tyrosine 4-hydroxyphenyl transferase CofH [Methanomicrobiaceae archaeon]|nr:5-amino-6-(D-ribitylamino)uracil--L-tyrosine 4-hydroxyphenyl transferase CofH [Methanomicrobiaceae archaeon]
MTSGLKDRLCRCSTSETGKILENVLAGNRLTKEDALTLLNAKGRDVFEIASAADIIREEKTGSAVTYVRNQNLNFTNYCINSCGFCSFCRKSGDSDIFCLSRDEIVAKVNQAKERGVSEICSVGGLHPDFDADTYTGFLSLVHETAPEIHIHANNPMEVWYGAEKSGISTVEMLSRMKEAGLGSMCGTAAEILVDDIRKVICPGKVDTKTWERIIREAHGLGIKTTATIMYGHIESPSDIVTHLDLLRNIQDDTRGFLEFVPLSFIHNNTPIYLAGRARAGATGREDILMTAVSRLFLDNFDNIQVSWVKSGKKLAQLLLMAGGNDLGGTMFEESISKEAGASDTEYLDPEDMKRMAEDCGRKLVRRTTLYDLV